MTNIHSLPLRIDYCDALSFSTKYTKLYYISLDSQMKKLSELMSYITIDKEVSKRGDEELENRFFNFYFLN